MNKSENHQGIDMSHRVFGWIKAALKDIEPKTELIQREWKSLKEISRPVIIYQKR